MLKTKAIELLGGSTSAAAVAIGVTYTAINKWPETLTEKMTDRVHAALWRVSKGIPHPKRKARASKAKATK